MRDIEETNDSPVSTEGPQASAVEDLARLVCAMGSLMAALSGTARFRRRLDLLGWSVGSLLRSDPGMTAEQIGGAVGASAERVRLLLADLVHGGLIEETAPPGAGLPSRYTVTGAGETALDDVNAAMSPSLDQHVGRLGIDLRKLAQGLAKVARFTVSPDG